MLNKIILFFIISINLFCYPIKNIQNDINNLFTIVEKEQQIVIDGQLYTIDIERLIWLTSGMESNFGRDKYTGRVAKTYMQLEPDSAEHYLKIVPQFRLYLTSKLNRDINVQRNSDAVYVTYLFYMSKLQYHFNWIDKYKHIFYETKDLEWFIYKLYFNSVKGHSTFKRWKYRENILVKEGWYL